MILSAEQFRNHLVWTSLRDLGPLIDQAMANEGLEAEGLEELARLKSVLSFTGKRLAGADPYLFQPTILDAISTALTTSATHVRNFIANSNPPVVDILAARAGKSSAPRCWCFESVKVGAAILVWATVRLARSRSSAMVLPSSGVNSPELARWTSARHSDEVVLRIVPARMFPDTCPCVTQIMPFKIDNSCTH